MPKPNGDNRLTKELLQLRGGNNPIQVGEPESAGPEYKMHIEFSGPGFSATFDIRGERWAAEKLLDDFRSSLSNM